MHTGSFTPLIEIDDFYKDITDGVEKQFSTSNYDERRRKNHNLQEKNKKVFRLIKDKRGGKIITKFSTIAPKTYGYSVQKDYHEIEDAEFIKAKGVKKSAYKDLTFHDFDVFTM